MLNVGLKTMIPSSSTQMVSTREVINIRSSMIFKFSLLRKGHRLFGSPLGMARPLEQAPAPWSLRKLRPLPLGLPPLFSDLRGALCDTLPYWKAHQGGVHSNAKEVYSRRKTSPVDAPQREDNTARWDSKQSGMPGVVFSTQQYLSNPLLRNPLALHLLITTTMLNKQA